MNRTNVGNSLLDGLETENRNDRPCWSSEQLLGFDLETTGVDPFSDVPVSAALVHVNAGSPELTDHFIIDPEREIPAGATAVHGITTERAREFGIPLDQGLDRIMNALNSSAANDIPVVGMNICYDLTIVDTMLGNRGGDRLSSLGLIVIDILTIDRHFDRFRKGKRTLQALCDHYGAKLTDAHSAAGDAAASVAVMLAQVAKFSDLKLMSVEDLHKAEIRWHSEWAAGFSDWLVSQGRDPLPDSSHLWPISSRSAI